MKLAEQLKQEQNADAKLQEMRKVFLDQVAGFFRRGGITLHLNIGGHIGWNHVGEGLLKDPKSNYNRVGSKYAPCVREWLEEEGFKISHSCNSYGVRFIEVSL